MPEIVVAEYAGACYGVQRALDLVSQVAQKASGPIYTLGPLIHNPQVVAELEGKGVKVTLEVPHEPEATLVLRTHGVVPEVEQTARAYDIAVVDATCPYVKRVHHAIERLVCDGYQPVVIGEAGHPEVEAIIGHAPGAIRVENTSELDGIKLGKRVGVVVQTTQTKANFDAIIAALTSRCSEVCVHNTICNATSERQEAAAKLAKQVDVMVVIGGHNSANTTHLAEICHKSCSNTYHIEACCELEPSWFRDVQTIGVTAGASTPASQIEAVVDALQSMYKES